jgi:hypothetical protein
MVSIPWRYLASLWVLCEGSFCLRKWREVLMTLSVEGVLEHGKLWCLVNHMWKMLWLWL